VRLHNSILIAASPDIIFRLAANVERWPDILPHYRWVRLVGRRGNQKLVKMAAHRDGLPVSWTAIQEPRSDENRILFHHVGGVTRGMAVEWRLESLVDGQTSVSITHDFSPDWPLIGGRVAHLLIGEFFVRNIADKTLRSIKALAEAEQDNNIAQSVRPQ
jgi:ribosome-associated toxin RatA of RatAB toxin-antitoxin module